MFLCAGTSDNVKVAMTPKPYLTPSPCPPDGKSQLYDEKFFFKYYNRKDLGVANEEKKRGFHLVEGEGRRLSRNSKWFMVKLLS